MLHVGEQVGRRGGPTDLPPQRRPPPPERRPEAQRAAGADQRELLVLREPTVGRHLEHAVQAGDGEQLHDPLAGANHGQGDALIAGGGADGDERAEPGRVQEADVCEVDHDRGGLRLQLRGQPLAQLRRRMDVDLARH